MDNTIVATHSHEAEEHAHVALPQHRHHFETEQQQREAGTFGMWLFLLTEIMFFGGLFFAYLLYRNWYPAAFVGASNQLSIPLGAFNTAVLIGSGFFMALGVWAAEVKKQGLLVLFLVLTTVLGLVFLGDIDHDHPAEHTDLRRGQADAGCYVHGFEHVIHQRTHGGVHLGDRLGLRLEAWIGGNDDRKLSHFNGFNDNRNRDTRT